MIPYQINDRTYFLPESFYYDSLDLPLNEFVQLVLSGSYFNIDTNDSIDSEIEGSEIIIKLDDALKTDETDRLWLNDEKDFFD